jgi:hypothetical protein
MSLTQVQFFAESLPPTRRLQRDVVCLCRPMASTYTSPNAGGCGGGCGVSANEYSCAPHVTWSPNKLWRSTSIFNLYHKRSIRHRRINDSPRSCRRHLSLTKVRNPKVTNITVKFSKFATTQNYNQGLRGKSLQGTKRSGDQTLGNAFVSLFSTFFL